MGILESPPVRQFAIIGIVIVSSASISSIVAAAPILLQPRLAHGIGNKLKVDFVFVR